MTVQRQSPGRWLYLLSLIIFFVGVVIAIILGVLSVRHFTNLTHSFVRVIAPGTTTVQLTKTGTYTIFYEYKSQVDGQNFSTGETPPNLLVSIKSVETGSAVDIHSSSSSSSYSIGSRSGVAVLNFNIDNPGAYEVTTRYSGGSTGQEVVLAIGHGFAQDLVGGIATIFGSVGIFCGATIVAIVLTIVVFFLRQRRPNTPAQSQVPPASTGEV